LDILNSKFYKQVKALINKKEVDMPRKEDYLFWHVANLRV